MTNSSGSTGGRQAGKAAKSTDSEAVAGRPVAKSQDVVRVSSPSDPFEREADKMADRVMQLTESDPGFSSPDVRRGTVSGHPISSSRSDGTGTVSRSSGGTDAGGSSVDRADVAPRGSGKPLDPSLRSWAGQALGADFSQVRIHTDGAAAASASNIGAAAYTLGSDIVFGQGRYQPNTSAGQRLLAHELTHVKQHRGTKGCEAEHVHRDGPSTPTSDPLNDERSVVNLSGAYESVERLDGGHRKLTTLFVSVSQASLVGNYRSFINNGDGYDAADSGDIRAVRVASDEVRYDGTGDSGPIMMRFGVRETGGLAGLVRGGVVRPLVVTGLDGVDHVFRRRGRQSPVTLRNVRDAEPDEAPAIDRERRRGLTSVMIRQLEGSATEILEYLSRHPDEGLSSQRLIVRRHLAEQFDASLSGFRGGLREDARSVILRRLETGRVLFLGDRIRADRAVLEALNVVAEGTSEASAFRYEIVFRGVRASGSVIVGLQFASGSVEVNAYRASTIESTPETLWTRNYGFQETRLSARAGGGASGGVYWRTFNVTTPVEWTQQDFQEAEIGIFGVQGPEAGASVALGPGSLNLGNCQTYQFEGIALSSGPKTLELQAEESVLVCSSDVTAGSDAGGATVGGNDEGGAGVRGEAHLGQVTSGMGHLVGVGEDYSDERQQVVDPIRSTRGSANVHPSTSAGGYSVGSAALASAMRLEIAQQLGSYQALVRDPTISLRVVGHSSSLWRGRSDPIAGNLALSRDRARAAADMIRAVFELGTDRVIDVAWRGDTEARAAGNTSRDDDPAYRRVDVHIGGSRTVAIRF